MINQFICPCCGYDKLEKRPYKYLPDQIDYANIRPPYSVIWGDPSYEHCPCCSYQFGNSDTIDFYGESSNFSNYLLEIFGQGNDKWFEPKLMPNNWSLILQLEKAKIPVPEILRSTMAQKLLRST